MSECELQMLASLRRQQNEDLEDPGAPHGLSASQVDNCNVSISTSSDDTTTWNSCLPPVSPALCSSSLDLKSSRPISSKAQPHPGKLELKWGTHREKHAELILRQSFRGGCHCLVFHCLRHPWKWVYNDCLSSPVFCSIDENQGIYKHKCLFYSVLKSRKPRVKRAAFGKGFFRHHPWSRMNGENGVGMGMGNKPVGRNSMHLFIMNSLPQ